ncbi:hypothetical protein J8273_7293 [Carpediemonas membranifera]|uniref:Uncharacterized protein n=1 Tax=Carpediemonas membranifera TaxID=201153 RepID=A0A8J6B1N7_9EUKA|nr:hypothetical protein J8273_7293 [Carpediemonas membranifera]|eukprot:KAG9391019.1 hypothetical protein J8273_7293 [Carpediemonas membranifera]
MARSPAFYASPAAQPWNSRAPIRSSPMGGGPDTSIGPRSTEIPVRSPVRTDSGYTPRFSLSMTSSLTTGRTVPSTQQHSAYQGVSRYGPGPGPRMTRLPAPTNSGARNPTYAAPLEEPGKPVVGRGAEASAPSFSRPQSRGPALASRTVARGSMARRATTPSPSHMVPGTYRARRTVNSGPDPSLPGCSDRRASSARRF